MVFGCTNRTEHDWTIVNDTSANDKYSEWMRVNVIYSTWTRANDIYSTWMRANDI
jgi:hypothetical protein